MAVVRAALSNPVSRDDRAVRQLRVCGGPARAFGALGVGHELARAGLAAGTAVIALLSRFYLVVAARRFVGLSRTFITRSGRGGNISGGTVMAMTMTTTMVVMLYCLLLNYLTCQRPW